jgi:hypothetical protein
VANDHLRAALQAAGLAPDDLAQIVQVDVRTVRRWLSGGTPYARQRGKVARALDTTEHDLWPEIPTAPAPSTPAAARASDLVAGYPAAGDLAAPEWRALMAGATDRIELLGHALTPILDTPGVPELLATRAAHGCSIRILVDDTGPHLAPILNEPGIEIRLLEDPAVCTIHRFDDELLLTLHMIAGEMEHMPLIHVRRAAPEGMFDRLTEYYDDLWERDSRAITPDPDPAPEEDADEGENPESDPPRSPGERPPVAHNERTAPSPRRWPRRPEGAQDDG